MSGLPPWPWKTANGVMGALVLVDANDEPILEIFPDEGAEDVARLIAAAPDLLEATKAHLEQCTEDTWQGLIDAVSKAEESG